MSLNWADLAILLLVGFSIIISLVRGFVKEGLSLLSWLIAIWVALNFYEDFAVVLSSLITSSTIRQVVAFFGLFLATLLVGSLCNFFLSQLVRKTGLSGTDRSLGMVFGAGRGILIVALLMVVTSMTSLSNSTWWQQSYFLPKFKPVAQWLVSLIPSDMQSKVIDEQQKAHSITAKAETEKSLFSGSTKQS